MEEGNDWKVLVAYTRQNALDDGVLVDVTKTAEKMGYRVPVAVSGTLMTRYLRPSEELESAGQSLEGRLCDLLFLLLMAIAREHDGDFLSFKADFLSDPDGGTATVEIFAEMGPDDDGRPVLTVMLGEDL